MPWYWVLLIVAVVQTAFLLAFWFLLRGRLDPWDAALQVSKLKGERLEAEVEAERVAKAKAEQEMLHLAKELAGVQTWYHARREQIPKEAQDEFRKLLSDPAELDRRLNLVLGVGSDRSGGGSADPG